MRRLHRMIAVTKIMRNRRLLTLPLLFACATSHATIIDFEGFAAGTIIDDEYANVVISATNPGTDRDLAVIFDTENVTGKDYDLGQPFTPGDFNPGNVLIIQERTDNCSANSCPEPDDEGSRPAGELIFDFLNPVMLQSIDFFDIEASENKNNPFARIFLYDAGDILLGLGLFVPGTGGDNTWARFDFGTDTLISKLVIGLGGSGAVDRLVYNVPEPGTLALFGAGLLGFGIIRRKRAT